MVEKDNDTLTLRTMDEELTCKVNQHYNVGQGIM